MTMVAVLEMAGTTPVMVAVSVAVPGVAAVVKVKAATPSELVVPVAVVPVGNDPRSVERVTPIPPAGFEPLVTFTATDVVVVPFAGNRVRAGVISMPRPEAVSVQTPDLQRKVGEPTWHCWFSQAVSAQSMFPLQSLSLPSLQVVSVDSVGTHEAAPTQVDGVVLEQVPVPPPEGTQAWVGHAASAVQSTRHTVASAPKLMDTWATAVPCVAVTSAVPAQFRSVEASQVTSVSVPVAPGTVAVAPPPVNVPRLVLTETGPPEVSVTVSVTEFVPFATTAFFEAVMPTEVTGPLDVSFDFLQPAKEAEMHKAAASVQALVFMDCSPRRIGIAKNPRRVIFTRADGRPSTSKFHFERGVPHAWDSGWTARYVGGHGLG